MALTSWKSFNFFEVSPITFAAEEKEQSFFEDPNLASIAAGSGNVFLGGSNGSVRVLSRAFQEVLSFKTGEDSPVTHIRRVQDTSYLVTVSEDLSAEPILQVWALDKTEKKTGAPKCLSRLLVHNGRKQFPVSSFITLGDLSQVAVGFANGSVTVIRGDLIHDRGARQRTVFESDDPITGLEIRQTSSFTILYIATTGRILTLTIAGKGQGQPARTLDSMGCGVGCMAIDKSTGDLVVVRDDAIYYYGPNGRGPCYAFDGPKKLTKSYNDYLAVVMPPQIAPTNSAPMRPFGGLEVDDIFSASRFILLDTDLKFIAHSETLISQIRTLFEVSGDFFLLTVDGKLFQYQEKTFDQKLEILYQRNLYVLAINLAQKAGVDTLQQNVIFRKYGDYLYQKGDYDTAMQQYLRAIDNTEPSQVIRKYLDTQRIHNLIEYLEELHDHDTATPDHTTLLLNCYAKLKDVDKLESFIKQPGELKFDLDTAISMCRQGGYYEQAAYLATKHGEHSLVIDILIEDSKKYAEALAYICRLDASMAYPNLMKYARVLLEHCPEDATQIFIDYYTGQYEPHKDIVLPAASTSLSGPMSAVQSLASFLPLPYMGGASDAPSVVLTNQSQAEEQEAKDDIPSYEVPKPRTAFSSFVDHPHQFIKFLEACLASPISATTPANSPGASSNKTDLYTTLFEIYLSIAQLPSTSSADREGYLTKAKALIDNPSVSISPSSVLLLSSLNSFSDGAVLVRERQHLYLDIFRSYTSAHDTASAIKALHKYGSVEPQLYPLALSYFASSPTVLDEAGNELSNVLRIIQEKNLLAPLQVIQLLSKSAVVTMAQIKPYLSSTIASERSEIASNRTLISSYRSETASKRAELDSLTKQPTIFQARRCAACSGTLDLPVVHFLCKHSFHQRCLNVPSHPPSTLISSSFATSSSILYNSSNPYPPSVPSSSHGFTSEDGHTSGDPDEIKLECPLCVGQNETIRAIRRAREETSERHELFKDALERSGGTAGAGRLATVGEWLGRGVMRAESKE